MDSIPHWGTKIPHATQCSLYMCVCVYIYIEREREKERERERAGWREREREDGWKGQKLVFVGSEL